LFPWTVLSKNKIKTSYLAILVTLVGSISIAGVYATEESPYESGRGHGCDDADLSPSDRYINEPGMDQVVIQMNSWMDIMLDLLAVVEIQVQDLVVNRRIFRKIF
jgi:hypothetical protein